MRSRVSRGHRDLAANYSYLNRDNVSDPTVPLTETPVHKGLVSVTIEPLSDAPGVGATPTSSQGVRR